MKRATVIGGGPAGSAAAIRLARGGWGVTLYEKTVFPRAKLCGGFLSPEGLSDLEDLGVLSALHQRGAPRITKSVVVSQKNTRIECALPHQALSVARDVLDDILIQQAAREGVSVIWGQDGFSCRNDADITIVAAGRLHRESLSLRPKSLSPWYAGSNVRYVGIQALFARVQGMEGQVELDLVPSGYIGLAEQEQGVNVCALTTEESLRKSGSDLDGLLENFMNENPAIAGHLKDAERKSPWMTVGPVRLGIRKLAEDRTFYVGDAACVMDPFAGEGMAMGLYASRLLMMALEQKNPEKAYRALWQKVYRPALRWNAVMRWCYSMPVLRELVLHGLQEYPRGMTLLTDLTRYRPVAA